MGFSRQEDWSGVPLPSPILYIVVCICHFQTSNLSLLSHPQLSPLVIISLFSVPVSFSVFSAGVAPVGDLTLITPSVLSADGVYGEGAAV